MTIRWINPEDQEELWSQTQFLWTEADHQGPVVQN